MVGCRLKQRQGGGLLQVCFQRHPFLGESPFLTSRMALLTGSESKAVGTV